MVDFSRRGFFRALMCSAAAATTTAAQAPKAQAAPNPRGGIDGICVYVEQLDGVQARIEDLKARAPGRWQVRPFKGELLDVYLDTRNLCRDLEESTVNSVVGFSDPATFGMIREAVTDAGSGFHYMTYETPHLITFSVKV